MRNGCVWAVWFPRTQTSQGAALNRPAAEVGLTERTVEVDKAGERIHAGHFHPHEFRHTAASLDMASGADVQVVQQMLGHGSAAMAPDHYRYLYGDRLDVVADPMEVARLVALEEVR